MKKIVFIVGTALFMLIFNSFSLAAQKVQYPAPGVLVPGETTYDQVIELYGKPEKKPVSEETEEGTLLSIYYIESGSMRKGFLPMRHLGFNFKDNILTGFDWFSSFKDESSDYDDTKIDRIKKGETTWEQVIQLMNCKYGIYTYPKTDSPDDRALVYMYSHHEVLVGFKTKTNVYTKVLIVVCDKDGIVKDVQTALNGEKNW